MSKYLAGIDLGNVNTKVVLAKVDDDYVGFIGSYSVFTTGLKGTLENVKGIVNVLDKCASQVGLKTNDIDIILLNEAAPVIGDLAMETITETILTESILIGHDPTTPGGVGLGTGITYNIKETEKIIKERPKEIILIIPQDVDFEEASNIINNLFDNKINVNGLIVQNADGRLISNRLKKQIPIVDEVSGIEKVPLKQYAAVEVAPIGKTIEKLSDPYGIASIFNLTAEETKKIIPIARALIGNRSAVVIKTPKSNIKQRIIPAGTIQIIDKMGKIFSVDIGRGAEEIMKIIEKANPVDDVIGEAGTNVGSMLARIKVEMGKITNRNYKDIKIKDIFAVDTMVSQRIIGAVAGEHRKEKATAIAAMVETNKLTINEIAKTINNKMNVKTIILGNEALMAGIGALTTPGVSIPFAVVDIGGGSTDIIYISENEIKYHNYAGAGNLLTKLIATELGIDDLMIAEDIKRYPLAKVESFFSLRFEQGNIEFFKEPFEPNAFGKVVILKDGEIDPLETKYTIEEIRNIRRKVKYKVITSNIERGLKHISPTGDIRDIPYVVLVGGSILDYEIPQILSDYLAEFSIVCGRANILNKYGPNFAVSTGLILTYLIKLNHPFIRQLNKNLKFIYNMLDKNIINVDSNS